MIVHDMDKMCKILEADDLNKTIANVVVTESAKRCESPVFKCINQTKSLRANHLDSSDYDISSYQVNQSANSRTSNKSRNETSESVLPFSPIFSPIPVAPTSQFQSPSVHSLAALTKNLDKACQNKLNKFSVSNKTESFKGYKIFESLGMTDKDISWVSSMASPPPKQVPGSEFNTVEKATFFPEEKFQSIQPRALFSPTFDEDFGCHPIIFTSESDNEDEAYKSNIRLSDVCATLKQLEVKSLDQPSDTSGSKIINEENYLISPVIKTGKKKKLGSVKKKKKGALVISPENKDNYEFSVGKNIKTTDKEKVRSSCGNNFIEDDSFQSISFSCIDELCKTIVTEQSSSSMLNSNDFDKTLLNDIDIHFKANNAVKKFYVTKSKTEVCSVSSMDNLHSYAKALEEGDKNIPGSSKIDESYTDKGIVRFDILNKDSSKTDATKQLHSEMTVEKDKSSENKHKKIVDENSDWEKAKQYLSESQLNVSDTEIFRTVENLEKTLASQESKEMEKLSIEGSVGGDIALSQNSTLPKVSSEGFGNVRENADEISSKDSINLLEISKIKTCNAEVPSLKLLSGPCSTFTTASGSKISISETALTKAKKILKDCFEDLKNDDCQNLLHCLDRSEEQIRISRKSEIAGGTEKILMKGFSTCTRKQIEISAESLEETKLFMSDCEALKETSKNSEEQFQVQCNESKEKFLENVKNTFLDVSGEQNKTSIEAFMRADSFMSEGAKQYLEDYASANFLEGFSTGSGKKIQVSAKALEKARVLMVNCYEKEEMTGMKSFITGFGKPIQVSVQSLERAKAFLSEYDENFKKDSGNCGCSNQITIKPIPCNCDKKLDQNLTSLQSFSTGSGKTIQISSDDLEKAKAFMKNYEVGLNKSLDELASVRIKKLNNEPFYTYRKEKVEENACGINYEKLQTKQENSRTCVFSTALGHEVKVSSKAIEKAKAFWHKSDEMSESLGKEFFQTEPSFESFKIANESKVTMRKDALTKPKEKMIQWNRNVAEHFGSTDNINADVKTSVKNVSKTPNPEENPNKLSSTSEVEESNDWDKIIPSWLHVYNTSPSMISDRIELSPIISHEDGKLLKSDREYLVKSPVLGSGDRFYGKKRSRKLLFEEVKKPEDKKQNAFVVPYKNAGQKISAKRTSNLSVDFSVPFKKMKFVEDVKTVCLDVMAERMRARKEQEKIVREKQRVKPFKGSYLSRKCSEKQMSWREAVAGSSPEVYSVELLRSFGILNDVLQITIETAVSFRFNAEDFFGSNCQKNVKGIPTGDGCLLILDDENKFGVEEVKRAFLASPGVQPNLVPQGWVENHFKWIVWKLAHYERSFPRYFGGRCLTPNHLMLQLKYRYDREIDRNERPALKKILERDDSSIKRLALCICGIKKISESGSTGYELSITDGWYSCPVRSDPAMTRLIKEGKLHIGTKLLIQGATLVNCEQGVSPLEINDEVYLKISTNSTRRARWDTKLGFQKNPKNFPISLGSILPQGGQISRIDVIIVRIYPMLYMEKTLDGHHVTRNRRSEEKADAEHRRIQEQRMEVICDELQSEMRKSANYEMKLKKDSLINAEQDVDLCQLMETCSDLSDLQNLIMSSDERNLDKDRFNRVVVEKLEKEKLNKRNVSEFLRAKIVDFRKPDYNNPALLSVWKPSEDLTALLSEGKVLSLMNLTVSNSSRTHKPLQINTTRLTQYKQISKNVKYPARKLTHLKDISSKICPAFEEVDVVGMVALIQDVSYGSKLSQIIYLTNLEMDFIGVVFWGSCKDYGWENVLSVSSVVACSNLQWKKNENSQSVPSLYVNENSVFTENPRLGYLKEEIERLKQNTPQDINTFLSKCEENLMMKLEDSKWRSNTSKNLSSDSTLKETHPKMARGLNGFESKPTASSTPIKPFTVGKSFSETEPSPIQKRIEKLQSYGEPPSLIPLLLRNNAKRKFKKKS